MAPRPKKGLKPVEARKIQKGSYPESPLRRIEKNHRHKTLRLIKWMLTLRMRMELSEDWDEKRWLQRQIDSTERQIVRHVNALYNLYASDIRIEP